MAIASSTPPIPIPDDPGRQLRRGLPLALEGLHLAALWGFAVAQPLYDCLARSAEFFIARRAEPATLIAFTMLVSFAVPLALTLVEALAGPRRPIVHGTFIFCLLTTLALLGLHHATDMAPPLLIALCCVLAAIVTTGYVRIPAIRSYFTLLTPAVLVFPAWFLLVSPISHLVFIPRSTQAVYPNVQSRTPVVVILFDELAVTSLMDDNHRINAVRFPNFDRLADDAIWFRNVSTVADVTTNALPALLSGIYPDRPRQPTCADYPRNLFTMLAGAYRLNVQETITHLCPQQESGPEGEGTEGLRALLVDTSVLALHLILPEGLVGALPSVTQTWQNFESSEHGRPVGSGDVTRPAKLRRWIASIKADERPQLLFVHTIMPHIPWQYLPDGRQYSDTSTPLIFGMTGFETWGADLFHLRKAYRRHLLQTGFVDRLLGEIVARLQSQGLYDRALVVVAADHGLSFHPSDGRRFVSDGNHGDILSVPLFVKLPGARGRGRIDDRSVETVDVVPTIADVLHIDLPWALDGHSLLDRGYQERPRKVIFDQFLVRHEYAPSPDAAYASLQSWPPMFRKGPLDDLYRFSLHPEWVGAGIDTVASVEPDPTLRFVLQDADRYKSVDVRGRFLPVWVRGRLELANGPLPSMERLEIAIVVNGRIGAVTRTGEGPDAACLSSLVSPDLVHDGQNAVDVYLVRSDGRLARIPPRP